jgi:alanine racemase
MGRSGVLPEAAPALVSRLRAGGNVCLTGLYTHLATADETDKKYARSQFRRMMGVVESCGGRSGLTLHAANSAATIDLPETHLDMVRPGIAMYGYQPSEDMHNRLPLRPAMRLTGRLMQIKTLPAGSRCGYGLTYAFPRDARVGLVPIGYGDGYFRSLSNRASMRVRGQDVPIRGRVSMDQTILDLTGLPEARVGDEVEILSGDPTAAHSVENLAQLAETIPYELTCRLGRRVRRVLVD